MRVGLRRGVVVAGTACLIGSYLAVPMAASAASGGPVPFGQASFSGYAAGDELHVGALQNGGASLADVEEGFSSATTNSAGLTAPRSITFTGGTTSTVIQPAQAATTKAYGMGSGIEVGLAANNTNQNLNQLKLVGKAESIAPPVSPPVTKTFAIPNNPLITGQNVTGESDALYDPNVCPLGQPISFGLGDGTGIKVLPNIAGLGIGTIGTGTTTPTTPSTGRTDSSTFLNANSNGSFGLATLAREIVAPLNVTLPGLNLQITLSGSQTAQTPANPVTLEAVSNGDGTHSLKLVNDNFLTITLNGTPITVLSPITNALSAPRVVSLGPLGSIVVNTLNDTSSGNAATGDFTLFGINLNLAGALPILNLTSGRLIASATANSQITCTIPIAKTSNPPSLTAGNDFVYTIQIPDPAKLEFLACSLTNVSAVDTISDVPNDGKPTFQVLSASNGGKVNQTSPTNATVTYSGLSYTVAPVGHTPNPPITLTITVAVPKNSPAGTIQDIVNATGTAQNCNGGISGITNLGNVNGTPLTGSKTLQAPTVKLAAAAANNGGNGAGAGAAPSLPRTGGHGGLWQPALGLLVLVLGGGGLALARRSRRRTG